MMKAKCAFAVPYPHLIANAVLICRTLIFAANAMDARCLSSRDGLQLCSDTWHIRLFANFDHHNVWMR